MLKIAADALFKIHDCIQQQVTTCEAQVDSLRIRAGFLSLPDEILANVLELAAHKSAFDYDRQDGGSFASRTITMARSLSCVCKRFQTLILGSPNLWCQIWNGMSFDASTRFAIV